VDASYGNQLGVANMANQVMAAAREGRMRLPASIRYERGPFAEIAPKISPMAYDPSRDRLVLNPAFPWGSLQEWMRNEHVQGWFSSGNPRHLIWHELAHAHHAKENPQVSAGVLSGEIAFGPEEFDLARAVSGYAATDPAEFVAEVFAGLTAGKKYPAGVLALYKKYGGWGRL